MLDIAGLATITDARAASHDCPYCSGLGLATVYRSGYDGRTIVEDFDSGGRPFRRLMVTTAYCLCAAGRWTLANHQSSSPEIYARMNDLNDLLDSRKGSCWSPNDPTLPPFSPGEVPDWKELRRMINRPGGVVRTVPKPKPVGDRAEAFREMREPIPGERPAVEEPEECDVPF